MYYASKTDGFLGYPKNTTFAFGEPLDAEGKLLVVALPWEGTTYGHSECETTMETFMENVDELSAEHPLFRDMLSDIERHDLMKDENDTIYTCYGWVWVLGGRPMLEVHELDEPNMAWMKPTALDPMLVNRFSKENTTPEELLSIQIANFGGLPEPDKP